MSSNIITAGTGIITDWIAYIPNFAGFGTVTSFYAYSRRNGDSLEVKVEFIPGVPIASPAEISFGFNGTNGNVSIDPNKVVQSIGQTELVGDLSVGFSNPGQYTVLVLQGDVDNLYFGAQTVGSAGLTPNQANNIAQTAVPMAFYAKIPIAGWSAN